MVYVHVEFASYVVGSGGKAKGKVKAKAKQAAQATGPEAGSSRIVFQTGAKLF